MTLVFEMFLLSILARFIYRRKIFTDERIDSMEAEKGKDNLEFHKEMNGFESSPEKGSELDSPVEEKPGDATFL